MLVVVSDTSPVRALAHLGHLLVLKQMFQQVVVPPAVNAELLRPPGGLPRVEVASVPFLSIRQPLNSQRVREFLATLDPGEAEALALAEEMQASALLIDEAAGRRMAGRVGLSVLGTLGILLGAKQRNLLSAVRPLLDRLQNEIGFFVSDELRAEILLRAGE